MKRFSSSITLILIGFIYAILIIPRTCDGGAADFICPVLTVLFGVNLAIVILSGYIKWRRGKIRFNPVPIYVSLILLSIVLTLKIVDSEFLKGHVMIEAMATWPDSCKIIETDPKYLGYRLILRENNHYQITGLLPELACTYKGKFALNHDTIELENSFLLCSDTNLAKKYILDRKVQFLKPLNPKNNRTVYNKWWFKITGLNNL